MKTIICSVKKAMLTIAFMAIFSYSYTVVAMGNTGESYTITAVETATNAAVTTWDLQYSESGNSLKIFLTEKNGEKEYTVRGKFLEVSYVMNKNGFGARAVKNNKSVIPAEINSKVINGQQLIQQRIITPEQIDNEKALNLIAGFLPDLLNENYKHLLQ